MYKLPVIYPDGTFQILYLQDLPSRCHGYRSPCRSKLFRPHDTTRASPREGTKTRGANIYVQIDILAHYVRISFFYRDDQGRSTKENLVVLETKKSRNKSNSHAVSHRIPSVDRSRDIPA